METQRIAGETTFDCELQISGCYVAIYVYRSEYLRQLQGLLTYSKKCFDVKQGRSNITFKKIRCYIPGTKDVHGKKVPVVVTLRGYLPRIRKFLDAFSLRYRETVNGEENPVFQNINWDFINTTEWRLGQREAIESILSHFGGLINCPTGWGKSFLLRALCHIYPSARILISSYSISVIEQIYNDLKADESLSNQVGIISSRLKRNPGARILCCSGKSLASLKNYLVDDKPLRPFDILLIDEVHEFGAKSLLRNLSQFPTARRFGFSANCVDRQDNAAFELIGVFGEIIADITYQQAVQAQAVVPITVVWYPVTNASLPPYVEKTENLVTWKRWGIWRNAERNKLIAEVAKLYGERCGSVIITVETLEHGLYLLQELPEFTLIYASADLKGKHKESLRRMLKGHELTPKQRSELTEKFRRGELTKVIATSVWNRGVDFKHLEVLIRGDGYTTKIANTQIPGRVSRVYPTKECAYVVDFWDEFHPRFLFRSRTRKRIYSKFGWNQITMDRLAFPE